MTSDPTKPAAPATDPLAELSALLPEALQALSGLGADDPTTAAAAPAADAPSASGVLLRVALTTLGGLAVVGLISKLVDDPRPPLPRPSPRPDLSPSPPSPWQSIAPSGPFLGSSWDVSRNTTPGREPPVDAGPSDPRRPRDQPYVSPWTRARAILAQKETETGAGRSRKSIETARRIVKMEVIARRDLVEAQAPYRVVRWVVWGENTSTARAKRTELVLHLRKVLPTPYGGWPDERALSAAWDYWQAEIDKARRRGLIQPWADDLPVEGYQQAIAALPRATRRTSRGAAPSSEPEAVVLTAEEREALLALPPLVLKALPPLAGLVQRLGPR